MDEEEWEELVLETLRLMDARAVDTDNLKEGLQLLIDKAQHELDHADDGEDSDEADDFVDDEDRPLDLED